MFEMLYKRWCLLVVTGLPTILFTMRRIKRLLLAISAVMLLGAIVANQRLQAVADTVNGPSLIISQLKITSSNGQFVTLYNATNNTLDMSRYQLEYFNNYDLAKATSSKLIALTGMVPPHGYFMVNDSALLLCYQLTVDSVSLGFSSTAGLVEVLAFNQSNPGGSVTPLLQDYVGWSKLAAPSTQTLPSSPNAFLQRQPADTHGNPTINMSGTGSWQAVQPDINNVCNLIGVGSGGSSAVPSGLSQLLPSTEPPSTIVSLQNEAAPAGKLEASTLPEADIGAMAPKITEILPNPIGSGNDASDEFIELYNPNPTAFDLSGFGLQAGVASLHKFNFANGTILPPQSFTAFYSVKTGLSLSNSSGQVKLLDPFGNSISVTDTYQTAKEGQAWALANAKWYWTDKPTPGAANIINAANAAIAKKPSTKTILTKAKSSKSSNQGKVKGAITKKPKSHSTSKNTKSQAPTSTPVHRWVLVLVAGLALLYGAYEYRADLANRVYQFRKYYRTRVRSRA